VGVPAAAGVLPRRRCIHPRIARVVDLVLLAPSPRSVFVIDAGEVRCQNQDPNRNEADSLAARHHKSRSSRGGGTSDTCACSLGTVVVRGPRFEIQLKSIPLAT
jgi:hypothetical protein